MRHVHFVRVPVWLGLSLAAGGGAGIALQSRINSAVANIVDTSVGAAWISFSTGFLTMLLISLALPAGRAGLRQAPHAWRSRSYPRWYLVTGVGGAYFVLTQAVAVGPLGVALFAIAAVVGQVLSGLVVDSVGFGPAGSKVVTPGRLVGAVVAMTGAAVGVLGHLESVKNPGILLFLIVLPLVGGLLKSFQQAMVGRVAVAHGTPITSTLFNFGVGAGVLLLVYCAQTLLSGEGMTLPPEWWAYVTGPLGCLALVTATISLTSAGIFLTGLAGISGQMLGSLALDIWYPTDGALVGLETVLGVSLALLGVLIATLPKMSTSRASA